MFKKIIPLLILSALITTSCQNLGHDQISQGQIKIGAILPLTGGTAAIGIQMQNGLAIASQTINGQNGINGRPVEIIYEDSKGDPKAGVSAGQKLINQNKIPIFIVGLTGVSQALAPVLIDNNKIMLIAGSIDSNTARSSDNFFKHYTDVEKNCRALATEVSKRGFNQTGIVWVEDAWSKACLQIFQQTFVQQKNNQIIDYSYAPGSKEISSLFLKLKEKNIQAVFVLDYPWYYPEILEQMNQVYNPELLILSFAEYPQAQTDFTHQLFSQIETIGYYPNFHLDDPALKPQAREFINLYHQEYQTDPDYNAAYAHDNLMVLAQALKNCPSEFDNQCIIRHLQGMIYDGVAERVSFDPQGVSQGEAYLVKFENGKWIKLD